MDLDRGQLSVAESEGLGADYSGWPLLLLMIIIILNDAAMIANSRRIRLMGRTNYLSVRHTACEMLTVRRGVSVAANGA